MLLFTLYHNKIDISSFKHDAKKCQAQKMVFIFIILALKHYSWDMWFVDRKREREFKKKTREKER